MVRSPMASLRSYWNDKTPLQKAKWLYLFPEYIALAFGVRFFRDDQIVWYSYIPYVCSTFYVVSSIATVQYYGSHNQFGRAYIPLCTFGSFISVQLLLLFSAHILFNTNCVKHLQFCYQNRIIATHLSIRHIVRCSPLNLYRSIIREHIEK